ncbi:WGxxGxxG family protein [Mycobacterium sp. Marseille-P9652]|uniref:WGxxGxxG family protein n=1 Tax=Mycobacterium sp. Marseille-P9652 TaxID=2654950 RepID=UPI0012E75CD1|nr:WGxxGxxG family protein [Mycobacterium sp. Marseille-P9652]
MRKTIAAVSATGALLFCGAGVANAAVEGAPAPASTTTTQADTSNNTGDQQHSDKTGLWGLLGLLGLGGLAGLRGRRDNHAVGTGVGPATTPGRGV